MRSYLDMLPDEIYRIVYSYIRADVMKQIVNDMPLIVGIWPPKEILFLLQNGSDIVRSQSINNSYRRKVRHYREGDWYKLLIDLERPSAYKLQDHGFHTWIHVKVWDLANDGGVWWNSNQQPLRLNLAGWKRLLSEEDSGSRFHR